VAVDERQIRAGRQTLIKLSTFVLSDWPFGDLAVSKLAAGYF
jgi:hypothetical protein